MSNQTYDTSPEARDAEQARIDRNARAREARRDKKIHADWLKNASPEALAEYENQKAETADNQIIESIIADIRARVPRRAMKRLQEAISKF